MVLHIRTDPDGLGTMTMPMHQGVGSCTGEMTPSSSMCFNSSLIFSRSGNGTFLGVNKENGFASDFSLIVYSPLKLPKPENNAGYWLGIFCSMALMPDITSSALIAGSPNRLFCKWRMTNIL